MKKRFTVITFDILHSCTGRIFIHACPNSNNAIHWRPQSSEHDKQHAVKLEHWSITHTHTHPPPTIPCWEHPGENNLLTPRPPSSSYGWDYFSQRSKGAAGDTDDKCECARRLPSSCLFSFFLTPDNKSRLIPALLRWSAASPFAPAPLLHQSIYLWWCDQLLATWDALLELLSPSKFLPPLLSKKKKICVQNVFYWSWYAFTHSALCFYAFYSASPGRKERKERGGGGGV